MANVGTSAIRNPPMEQEPVDYIKVPGRLQRRLFITDKEGVEHEIRTSQDLEDILSQMTPEERKAWETNYRFAPIQNLTGISSYMGTARDLA